MFPRWKYHREKAPRIVASESESQALGSGWADSPADFGVITCPSEYQDDYEPELDRMSDPEKPRRGRPPKVNIG